MRSKRGAIDGLLLTAYKLDAVTVCNWFRPYCFLTWRDTTITGGAPIDVRSEERGDPLVPEVARADAEGHWGAP